MNSDANAKDSDFYTWIPSHPLNEDKCLFGHVAEYSRKKPDSLCYIGRELEVSHKVLQNCTCTIYDFECDYNYQRATDGTCKLIAGLEPADHSSVCADDNTISWTEPTGYRKIPLTTCNGGKSFDIGEVHPCPGHEKEFDTSRRGLHGFWLFIVICVPFIIGISAGYYVWSTNGSRTLGQIRLGDDTLDQNLSSTRDKLQEYTVIALSGAITVLIAIPTIAKFLWKTASTRLGRMGSSPAYYSPLHDDLLEDDPLEEDF